MCGGNYLNGTNAGLFGLTLDNDTFTPLVWTRIYPVMVLNRGGERSNGATDGFWTFNICEAASLTALRCGFRP